MPPLADPPWSKKAPLVLVAGFFAAGIVLQHVLHLDWTPENDSRLEPFLMTALAGSLAWAAIAWRVLRPPGPIVPLVVVTGFLLAAGQDAINGGWSPRHLQRMALRLPQHVVLRGTVRSDPTFRTRDNPPRKPRAAPEAVATASVCDFQMRVSAVRFHTAWEPACGKVEVRVRAKAAMPVEFGQELEVEGVLSEPDAARNFGLFDYATYLRNRGIRHLLRADGDDAVRILGPARGYGWVFAARKKLAERLTLGIEGDALAVGIVRGMLLGYREDIPPDVNDAFRRTGTLHVFAISGSHITLIALALILGLRLLRVPQSWVWTVVLPALVFYVIATGLRASSIRSLIMAAVVIGGWSLKRPSALLNNLAASALAVLAWDPLQLFDPGFLLSFVVVATLILLVPALERSLRARVEPDPYIPRICIPRWRLWLLKPGRWILALVAVSLAAWIGSLGLNIYYFNLVSFIALPANLLIVPLSFLSIALGVTSLVLGSAWDQIAMTLNAAHAVLIHAMVGVSERLASVPHSFFYVCQPPVPGVLLGYFALIAILTLWLRERRRAALGLTAACGMVLLAIAWNAWRSEKVRIDVLDVGGGQCVLITGPHFERVLLDAGSVRQAQSVVEPFLRSRGVNAIDVAIVSHGDAAHHGGFSHLLDRIPIRRVVASDHGYRSATYRQLLAILSKRRIPLERWGTPVADASAAPQSPLRLRSGTLAALLPNAEGLPPRGGRADDFGLVLQLRNPFGTCLFASDAGETLEGRLTPLAGGPVTLLIQGLHANETSFTASYLQAFRPEVIVLNSGEYPPTAYPSPEIQERLGASGARVLRTDRCGGVIIRMTPAGMQCRPFLPPPSG